MGLMTSKYAGHCRICRGRFDAGERIDYNRERGGAAHAGCVTPVPQAAPQGGTLAADGTVSMGYDVDALPLLRALPVAAGLKSAWDPAAKVWRASVSQEGAPRGALQPAPGALAPQPGGVRRLAVRQRRRHRQDLRGVQPARQRAVPPHHQHGRRLPAGEVSMTPDQAALRLLMSDDPRRQEKLTELAERVRNDLENREPCDECGHEGPHDDNGLPRDHWDYTRCCPRCGHQWSPNI